jgi:type I restriction enzyme S subunit
MTGGSPRKTVAHAEWLGTVPASWQVTPLFTVLKETDDRNHLLEERNLLSLSYGRIIRKDIDTLGGLLPESFDTYQIVRAGDIVLRLTDLQNDQRSLRVGLVPEQGIITSAYVNLRSTAQHNPRFLFYQLHNADIRKVFYNFGGGVRQSMKYADLKRLPILLPPFGDQCAIADFLDRETSKVDRLIQAQRRVLELTKELRLAAITQLCFGAGDLQSEDWFSVIPKTWGRERIATLATRICNGYVGPTRDLFVNSGVTYLQSLHIKDNHICFQPEYFVPNEWSLQHSRSILKAGDVLVVQTGDIGQVATVTTVFEGANCHALIVIRCRLEKMMGAYLSWVLNSSYGYHSLKAVQTGALHPHLNCGFVREIVIPVPELEEQASICRVIEKRVRAIEQLREGAESAVQKLLQFRSGLISAAVGGQIDVRTYRPQEAAVLCP